ncbi:MAG: hypothetical protein K2L82_05580 [Lachnospiraceae bacterium]|nr:hypothetical protein [Lachnospiraceae bacterium]
MKRIDILYKIFSLVLIFALAALTGCSIDRGNSTGRNTGARKDSSSRRTITRGNSTNSRNSN